MSCSLISFNSMYSLKLRVIFSELKFKLFIGGLALIKTGGMVSFKPPVSIPLFAQLIRVKLSKKIKKIKSHFSTEKN